MPDDPTPARRARLQPTVIEPTVGKPRRSASAENARSRHVAAIQTPTAIPGVERRRPKVSAADIERLSPGCAPAVAVKASRLVEGFVAQGARERDVAMWGHDAQRNHGDAVARMLEMARADALVDARDCMDRIAVLLEAIDLEAIHGLREGPGFIARLFRGADPRIDTAGELGSALAELDLLVRRSGDTLDPLLRLKDAMDEQCRRIAASGKAIEAAALSAAFLAEHLKTDRPACSRRFLERGVSLARTLAQIKNGKSLQESQIEEPLRVIAAIQDTVLVAIPAWLRAIAALQATSSAGLDADARDRNELQHQLNSILRQIEA